MKKTVTLIIIFLAAFNVFAEPIKFGFIDSDFEKVISRHQAAADYIGNKLGMTGARIIVAENTSEMANMLKEGKVDIFIDTIFATAIVQDLSGSKVILRRWKKGVAEYKTLFISTKKNGMLRDLNDMKGNVIGFSDEGSTSARWLPQALLQKRGYTVRNTANPGKDEIGFVYYNDDILKAVDMLFKTEIDVAAMSSNDYRELGSDVISEVKIIGESFNVPRQLISVRSTLDRELVKKIIEVATGLNKTPEGKAVLKNWEKTAKCDKINKDILDSMDFSRDLLKYMQ